MCAYCEEQKPLFTGTSITKNEIRSKLFTIQGRRIVKNRNRNKKWIHKTNR